MGGETEHSEYQGETPCTPLSPAVGLRLRLFAPLAHSDLCGVWQREDFDMLESRNMRLSRTCLGAFRSICSTVYTSSQAGTS